MRNIFGACSVVTRHSVPAVPGEAAFNWQPYLVQLADVAPIPMEKVAAAPVREGGSCRPGYMACPVQPFCKGPHVDSALPNIEKSLRLVIILALYAPMTDGEQHYVVGVLREALAMVP
jgi:hypothetical protein